MTGRRDFLKIAMGGVTAATIKALPAFARPDMGLEIKDGSDLASDSTAPVGTQLILALDNSRSMKPEEYDVERKATARALNSELFRYVIKNHSANPSIAVAVINFSYWALLSVPWVDIRGPEINDKPYQPGRGRLLIVPGQAGCPRPYHSEPAAPCERKHSSGRSHESEQQTLSGMSMGCLGR